MSFLLHACGQGWSEWDMAGERRKEPARVRRNGVGAEQRQEH